MTCTYVQPTILSFSSHHVLNTNHLVILPLSYYYRYHKSWTRYQKCLNVQAPWVWDHKTPWRWVESITLFFWWPISSSIVHNLYPTLHRQRFDIINLVWLLIHSCHDMNLLIYDLWGCFEAPYYFYWCPLLCLHLFSWLSCLANLPRCCSVHVTQLM